MTKDGRCEECPDYQIASLDKKSCVDQVCNGTREYVTKDSKCETCPKFEIPTPEKPDLFCDRPKCSGERERITE